MRIKLCLKTDENTLIPFNYQYQVASLIYSLIGYVNPKFAENIHNKTTYKFFTFSELLIKNREITTNGIKTKNGNVDLFVSSPNEEFIKNIVKALLEKNKIRFGKNLFEVTEIKLCETPNEIFELKTLSPIYVSTRESNKKIDLYPNNSKFFENLKKNLKNKYIEYFGKNPKGDIEIEVLSYLKKRINIKGFYYRCSHMKFRIYGDIDLIKFGYECGFGSRNSLGFGMVETIKKI